MLLAEEFGGRPRSFASRIRGLEDQAAFDSFWELRKILQQPKRHATTYLVTLLLAREVIDRLIEGRLRRDGDPRIALRPCCSEDVYLDAGTAEGRIRGRRSAMEDVDRQVCKLGIIGMVESDLVFRQGQLWRDSHHGANCEFVEFARGWYVLGRSMGLHGLGAVAGSWGLLCCVEDYAPVVIQESGISARARWCFRRVVFCGLSCTWQ